MHRFAQILVSKRVAQVVVGTTLVLGLVLGFFALRVQRSDDLLAFLPRSNADVATFYEINKRFGGLELALVGVETNDPFDAKFMRRLRKVTEKLNEEKSIGYALSLANVEDFQEDTERGGMNVGRLVAEADDPAYDKAALARRVMQKEQVVGNLISRDGKAVLILNFAAYGANPRKLAAAVQRVVRGEFPQKKLYWGGAPFISSYIYDITEADMRKLLPWAVVVILLIVVFSFRDVIGTILVLFSTSLGIVVAYGLMGIKGVKANIVLSSMPVILFAVGSAYGIHVMVRYYSLRRENDCCEALTRTLVGVGPTVFAAGLTTVAGLFSFMMMDIEPMQEFGLYTGLGILASLVLSLTFVPTVIRLLNLRQREASESALTRQLDALGAFVLRATLVVPLLKRLLADDRDRNDGLLVILARWGQRHRRALTVVLLVLVAAGAGLVGRVEARMENAAFFSAESPPAQAERFLRAKFDGSQYVQVLVEGDMGDPDVLRELQYLGDKILQVEHVSSVTHIAQVLALSNEAMTGVRRLPSNREQVAVLYQLLAGRKAVEQLVHTVDKGAKTSLATRGNDQSGSRARGESSERANVRQQVAALMMIKIDSDEHGEIRRALQGVERLVGEAVRGYRRFKLSGKETKTKTQKGQTNTAAEKEAWVDRKQKLVAARVQATMKAFGLSVPTTTVLLPRLNEPQPAVPTAVEKRLVKFLHSQESTLSQKQKPYVAALAAAVVKLGREASDQKLQKAVTELVAARLPAAKDDEATKPAKGTSSSEDDDDDDDDDDARETLVDDLFVGSKDASRRIWRSEATLAHARHILNALNLNPKAAAERGRLQRRLAGDLMDLNHTSGMVPSEAGANTLRYKVSGVPVLYRALSQSVTNNQFRSLGLALGLVLVIMMLLFRSVTAGMLAAAPTVFTLCVIYGSMGALGINLDIGTSMIASIIIGAGVDYAVHLLAAWRCEEGEDLIDGAGRAARSTGAAIWTNALMVAIGFFILTLGKARPLLNVGALTAVAMVTAGLATFLTIPALAHRRSYSRAHAESQ